jgi:hypothetical protein
MERIPPKKKNRIFENITTAHHRVCLLLVVSHGTQSLVSIRHSNRQMYTFKIDLNDGDTTVLLTCTTSGLFWAPLQVLPHRKATQSETHVNLTNVDKRAFCYVLLSAKHAHVMQNDICEPICGTLCKTTIHSGYHTHIHSTQTFHTDTDTKQWKGI